MLAIPKAMLDALDLAPDTAVGLSVKSGRIVVDPAKGGRQKHALDKLLAEWKRPPRRSREEKEWLAGPPTGRELI
jgi:antitoxin component of MazEF toxin-antitoxin module